MTMTTALLLGLFPAALVILGALLLMHVSAAQRTAQRLVLYLLVVATLFVVAIFIATLLTPSGGNQPLALVASLLTPPMVGVVALILLNAKRVWSAGVRVRIVASVLGIVVLSALAASNLPGASPSGAFPLVLYAAPALALIWAVAGRVRALPLVLAIGVLFLILLTNWSMANPPDYERGAAPGIRFFRLVVLYTLPGLTVAVSAILLASALQALPRSGGQGASEESPPSLWDAGARLALAVALVLSLAYTILWASIWDQTSDGIGGVSFAMQASVVGLAAGMILAFTQHGWRRASGLVFGLLVPVLMMESFHWGWEISYHDLTEERAARVEQALAQFHKREGHYPERLGDLVPQDLLVVPRPVILAGRDWCYESRDHSFRLAAFYREYFSTRLSLQVYAAAGDAMDLSACQQELTALKARYDPPGAH